MTRRNVRQRTSKATDQPLNQVAALEQAHDLVVQLRSEGLSLKAIAERVSRPGLRVDRNAVDRFCKKHNIPLGEPAEPEAGNSEANEPPVKYEAFPLEPVVVRRRPAAPEGQPANPRACVPRMWRSPSSSTNSAPVLVP